MVVVERCRNRKGRDLMVYYNYVSNADCTATYQHGARTDNITGLLVLRFSEGEEGFEIIKEPEKVSLWEVYVMREKISYEIG